MNQKYFQLECLSYSLLFTKCSSRFFRIPAGISVPQRVRISWKKDMISSKKKEQLFKGVYHLLSFIIVLKGLNAGKKVAKPIKSDKYSNVTKFIFSVVSWIVIYNSISHEIQSSEHSLGWWKSNFGWTF